MKLKIQKLVFALAVTVVFIIGVLIIIILNPVLTYASKTKYESFTIYHNQDLDKAIYAELSRAGKLIKASEFYNPKVNLDICLNDGSVYPNILRRIRGRAFAWGFYNKVVLQGNADYKKNFVELNGYRWNLTELFAHEMIHCFHIIN